MPAARQNATAPGPRMSPDSAAGPISQTGCGSWAAIVARAEWYELAPGKANIGERSRDVIALPGGGMPAHLWNAPLKSPLACGAEIYPTDPQVYSTDAPPH